MCHERLRDRLRIILFFVFKQFNFSIVFESFRGFGKATFLLSRCCAMSQSQENGEMDYSVRLPSSNNLLCISIKQGRVFLFRSTVILRIKRFFRSVSNSMAALMDQGTGHERWFPGAFGDASSTDHGEDVIIQALAITQ